MNPKRILPALCVVLPACGAVDDPAARSQEFLARANYTAAFNELGATDAERQAAPNYKAVELAYRLSRAQDLVFNDREVQALEVLQRVLRDYPDNEVAEQWVLKAHQKLAGRAVKRGDAERNGGDLEAALLEYADALGHVADFPPALEGRERVADVVRRKKARAEEHYYSGVQALGEKLWGLTWYHMTNAVDLDQDLVKARRRRDDARVRMIRDRYESAIELQEDGHFGAALKEFQDLAATDPELDGLAARIEHMRTEVRVDALVQDAEMAAFRRQYERARGLLEEALELTITEQARVSDLLILVRERDFEDRYAEARILELENRFDEALAAYQEIASEWPDFKDVQTLVSDLETTIKLANEAFARGQAAEQAGDVPGAIEAYRDALLIYPKFKGLDAKVAELEGRPSGSPGSGT